VLNTQIVQTTSQNHRLVREAFLGIAEDIFHHAGTLDARDGMFNPDAHLRYPPISFFLGGGQFSFAWLFFGW
jgi:hypothetical protein